MYELGEAGVLFRSANEGMPSKRTQLICAEQGECGRTFRYASGPAPSPEAKGKRRAAWAELGDSAGGGHARQART